MSPARCAHSNINLIHRTSSRADLRAGNLGASTDKIELLILGGTWSSYRRDYQEWFIKRCFDAMNEPEERALRDHADKLETSGVDIAQAQAVNETTSHRNVGLVIETRPDEINPDELRWLRHLGVTKVQMGAQSFDDHYSGDQQARTRCQINTQGHSLTARNWIQRSCCIGCRICWARL
ncbi:MAG: hypothetical protein IPJ46_22710 [Anaerolineales bacterium]|nr:hypothetical protein [Anaerolineales bacterium]